MGDLRFYGRVAIITGAGAGLGRSYALLFAARGAKVVVNDLGGGRHGDDGNSSKPADEVVAEIKRNGGTAVADYHSVVDGDKIIKTALDHFGRVDILINNAGILRDKSFARISDQDWDLIQAVHLKGSFKTTQAAFPIFKKQGYGRIIMTSSNSGLYGNFGQANYSSAKMGLVGLANTVAIEGAKYNIHCNVIVPTAASRLTQDIVPPDLFNELKPELIAPVVAYLCHECCSENGSIIESAAGWAGKCHLIRSNGTLLRAKAADGVTLESVRNNWERITDMSKAEHLNSIQETTVALVSSLENLRDDIPQQQQGQDDGDVFRFIEKDAILYALSVGASLSRPEDFRFIYENHEEFSTLPTFFILPAIQAMYNSPTDSIPGKSFSLEQLVHGEQYTEVLGKLPNEGRIISKVSLLEILDKGSGACLVYKVEHFNEQGELIVRNQLVAFIIGAGGFGGPRNGKHIVPCQPTPNRKPDSTRIQQTSIDQAALYRLTGDMNPIHIDPNMVIGTFQKPILHGLCTLGFSVRLILETYANGNTELFKACKARFMKPVIPGQTLKVDMWRDGNRIHFETSVLENNSIVIGGAYVDLKSVNMQVISNNVAAAYLESDAIFEFIIDQVQADPNKAKSIGGVFLYNITKNGKQAKQWTMDLKNAKVFEGTPEGKPNVTLTVADEDFMLMAQGKLQPQTAFMKGKLKVTGNIMLAQKLAPLLKANAKL